MRLTDESLGTSAAFLSSVTARREAERRRRTFQLHRGFTATIATRAAQAGA